jgi:hypothetical protein
METAEGGEKCPPWPAIALVEPIKALKDRSTVWMRRVDFNLVFKVPQPRLSDFERRVRAKITVMNERPKFAVRMGHGVGTVIGLWTIEAVEVRFGS